MREAGGPGLQRDLTYAHHRLWRRCSHHSPEVELPSTPAPKGLGV
jgi:hypothetical protein